MKTFDRLPDLRVRIPSPCGAATHDLQHAGVGVLILLLVAILGLYKPGGLTRYGRRRKHQLRAQHEDPRPAFEG